MVLVSPTLVYYSEAQRQLPGGVKVEDVRIVGSTVDPSVYILETARADGTTIPLLRIRLAEEAIRTASNEIAAFADQAEVAKAALHKRILELFL